LEVGSEFPIITNLRLLSGELEDDGARLRSLDLQLDLAYDGNFRIDVDAVMLLGKIANISITGEINFVMAYSFHSIIHNLIHYLSVVTF
jgi:hypothetical protein